MGNIIVKNGGKCLLRVLDMFWGLGCNLREGIGK